MPRELLDIIYQITSSGPTSMNTCPARFVFVISKEGKAKLAKSLKPANVKKMKTAPVTAILAHDLEFWTHLPFLFPREDLVMKYVGMNADSFPEGYDLTGKVNEPYLVADFDLKLVPLA